MNDNRYNSTRPGKILVTRKGINLMVGETYVIILNPSDVNEGEDVVVAPPPPINYTVSANGGTGDPRSPGYDTTTLTFTFLSPPASTPVMQKVSGAAALGTLTMVNATTYTATCSTSVVTQENLVVKCTTAGINQDDKTVVVYKHNSAPPSIVTTYRYIYKDSGLVPGSKGTAGNPVIRNGGAQSLQWFFEYETVTYENGVETARAATRKDQYGIWSRDTYSLANYISFNQVENTSASITVGNRGNPFYAYDDAAYYVNGKWPYKAPLTFGKQDKTFWGVTHVNVGTNVVDGHVIENMPRSDLTLYLLGPMTYPNELYGHQIDIMVTQ
jgi:hypothetical protein